MASVSFFNDTGLDVMFLIRDEDYLFANTASELMESFNAANIGDYAIDTSEIGATGEYVGILPSWLPANKRYTIQAAIVADAETPIESDWADSRFAVDSYWSDGANLFPDWAMKMAQAASPVADSPEKKIADAKEDFLDNPDSIDGLTPRQALRILGAVFGKSTGAGTTEETFLGFDGETPRVQVNTDEAGNRTSVTFFL